MHVSGSSCHISAVDFGQRGQLGPLGPQAVTQGVGPCVPAQRSRRSSSGELARSGRTPASVEIHQQDTKSSVVSCVRTRRVPRVYLRCRNVQRCLKTMPVTSTADRHSGTDGDRAMGLRSTRDWDRTDERVEAHRTLERAWPETAGDCSVERRSGRQSSGEFDDRVVGHGLLRG